MTVQIFSRTSTGLRVRLLAIILILIGPLAVLQALEIYQVRTTRIRITQERAFELAKAGAARFQDTIDDVRTVLDLLSRVPEVTSSPPDTCAKFLGDARAAHQWARSLSLIGPDHKVTCSTNPPALGFDVSDRPWFQSPRNSIGFHVSGFFITQVGGVPATFAALSFRNDVSLEPQVLVANIDLAWFDRIAATFGEKQNALVLLIDSDGVLLSRYPASPIPGNARISRQFLNEISTAHEGLFTGADPDGGQRLFGAVSLPQANAHVVIGFDQAATLGTIDRFIAIAAAVFSGVLLLGGFIVWVIGDKIFIRPIEALNGLLRTTLETMDQGLIAVDGHGRASLINGRAMGLLELPREFATTRPHQDEILEFQRRTGEFASEQQFAQVVEDIDQRRHAIYERERPNGTVLEIRTVPTADGGFVRTYSDITTRRAADAALRLERDRTETVALALEQANRRFDVALSNMSNGVCMFDADQKLVISNVRFREMYGLREDQVKPGMPLKEFLERHVARRLGSDLDIDSYIQVVLTQSTQTLLIADGRTVFIRREEIPGGGWIATHEDITDQKRIEAALRDEKDHAESAARTTSEFLANMSHELRTPLTAIIGVSDMLLSEPQSPEKQRHFMEMQRSAGQGLLGIINDILDFSKIEARQFDIETAPLSVREVAQGCAVLVYDQAQRKGLTVTVAVADDLHDWVLGDAARLRQILLNLVSNGVKFTPSGSVTLTVSQIADATDTLCFAVIDTGIGISAENIATLFQRFSQADSSTTRRFGGTGLGLAISKRLAELMGGDIKVKSEPGRGSTFSLTLRLPKCTAAIPVSAPAQPQCRASYRLLLAEDNSLNRQLIRAMLEQAGHEVTTVNDGAEAVRVAVRNEFDAILMDVQMPEMDGYAATRAIRQATQDIRPIPIIALTANALSGEAERCLAAGMDFHVPKPVSWPLLFATIDRLVLPREQIGPKEQEPAAEPTGEGYRATSLIFDRTCVAELRKAIGDQNTMRLLKLFVVDASQRFLGEPGSGEARAMICREAHAFAGSAGMLGFGDLAAACSALQSAELDDGQFDRCLDRCRRARDVALEMIGEMIVDDEFAGPLRTTA